MSSYFQYGISLHGSIRKPRINQLSELIPVFLESMEDHVFIMCKQWLWLSLGDKRGGVGREKGLRFSQLWSGEEWREADLQWREINQKEILSLSKIKVGLLMSGKGAEEAGKQWWSIVASKRNGTWDKQQIPRADTWGWGWEVTSPLDPSTSLESWSSEDAQLCHSSQRIPGGFPWKGQGSS